jgi:GxxExxY protein
MDADQMEIEGLKLLHADLTEKIIGVYYDVYNEIGHGFLESVYSNAMHRALVQAGLSVTGEPIDAFVRFQKKSAFIRVNPR